MATKDYNSNVYSNGRKKKFDFLSSSGYISEIFRLKSRIEQGSKSNLYFWASPKEQHILL